MDKLSLYDLLSFLVPGFIAFEWIKCLSLATDIGLPVQPWDYADGELGLIALCVSLFAGLFVHSLSNYLLRCSTFSKFVHWPVGPIVHSSEDLQHVLPQLRTLCNNSLQQPLFNSANEFSHAFFNHVYYHLEVSGKIDSVKGFQSIYFFLRNLFTLGVIAVLLTLFVIVAVSVYGDAINVATWAILAIASSVTVAVVPLARFYRKKMIERLFWSYCVDKHTNP